MRVGRTFIFSDLSGFTNYIERYGDGAGIQLLSQFRAIARAVGSHVGVRIDKYLGDGLMAVAVEQRDGIVFALELQRYAMSVCEPLQLRIGIASGDTMLFEGQDYIGTAPNLASRLCDAADESGVLIPRDQILQLPPGVEAKPHPPVQLRGFVDPIDVVTLHGEPELEDGEAIEEYWNRKPYVG